MAADEGRCEVLNMAEVCEVKEMKKMKNEMKLCKVSYIWAFIGVSNFGINAQRVFLVFGKR